LSATPFSTSNTDITNASLGLGTTLVSDLSAFDEKSVDTVSDVKTVSALNTALVGGSVTVDTLITVLEERGKTSLHWPPVHF